MMLIIGLFLIPFCLLLILKTKEYKTTNKDKNKMNLILILISLVYILLVFVTNKEPFQFDINSARDYIVYFPVIFLFSPFLWLNFGHFVFSFVKGLKIKKTSKIKNKDEYIYYREILNKISPSILMFVRQLDLDTKKGLSSTILKLKLSKNIKEEKNSFKTNKTNDLLKSEQMVINLIDSNKFDEKKYKDEVIKESLDLGYIRKNRGNIFVKLLKVILIITIPVITTILSVKFDSYVYDTYKTYIYDHKRYVLIEDEIGDIHFDHPDNYEDYYHGHVNELNQDFYDKSLVRADLYSNDHVKKTFIMQTLDGILFYVVFMVDVIFLYILIYELIFIKKKYKRTQKGVDIVNKSYALKNYLKDFSIINEKNEEELILWEYYLVYAVALGVNEKIDDKIINKYIK